MSSCLITQCGYHYIERDGLLLTRSLPALARALSHGCSFHRPTLCLSLSLSLQILSPGSEPAPASSAPPSQRR